MIKEYTIENFKAFAGPATVPIKPITLIFGPNSSGKSSIFQSLLMLKQTLEEKATSEPTISTKGILVDLGGFLDIAHKHKININECCSFKVHFTEYPKLASALVSEEHFPIEARLDSVTTDSFRELCNAVENDSHGLEFKFSYDKTLGGVLSEMKLYLGNTSYPFITYRAGKKTPPSITSGKRSKRKFRIAEIDKNHSFWSKLSSSRSGRDKFKDEYPIFTELREAIKKTGRKTSNPNAFIAQIRIKMKMQGLKPPKYNNKFFYFLDKELLSLPELYTLLSEKNDLDYLSPIFQEIEPILNKPYKEITGPEKNVIKRFNRIIFNHTFRDCLNFPYGSSYESFVYDTTTDCKDENGSMRDWIFYPIKGLEDSWITVDRFLPNSVKGHDPVEIIYENQDTEDPDSENLSLLTLASSHDFRRFLDSIIYMGPMREWPHRYYSSTGRSIEEVGTKGEKTYDVLIRNDDLINKVNNKLESLGLIYKLKIVLLGNETEGIYDLYAIKLYDSLMDVYLYPTDVGFGVSQVLPIIVQSMLSKEKTILIEQPELHLHPAQQAELGDMFIEAALGENKNTFLIETHSEHLILRIQKRIREKKLRPEDVAVIYVSKEDGGSKCLELRLDEEGNFIDHWPDGFFEERYMEMFD